MKVYKLNVKSDIYANTYTVRADNLSEASKLAKVKFTRQYKYFKNIKVGIAKDDIKNHIEEIMETLYKSSQEVN